MAVAASPAEQLTMEWMHGYVGKHVNTASLFCRVRRRRQTQVNSRTHIPPSLIGTGMTHLPPTKSGWEGVPHLAIFTAPREVPRTYFI
jgi:hypothetical protein